MSIKTELTQGDYSAFVSHVQRSIFVRRTSKAIQIVLWISIFVVTLTIFANESAHPNAPAIIIGGIIGAFVVIVYVAYLSKRQRTQMRPEDGGFILAPQEVLLEDEGIRQRSHFHESLFKWHAIRNIAVTDAHIFIMIDRVAGVILPKRVFASESEWDGFVSEIERRCGKSRTLARKPVQLND